MDPVENDFSAENSPEYPATEIASLRQQVWTLLVLLLIVSGTFSIYLTRQVSYARSDLANIKAQTAPLMLQFQKESQGMDQFIQRMGEYARTHPDFMPILNKYGINITPTTAPAPNK